MENENQPEKQENGASRRSDSGENLNPEMSELARVFQEVSLSMNQEEQMFPEVFEEDSDDSTNPYITDPSDNEDDTDTEAMEEDLQEENSHHYTFPNVRPPNWPQLSGQASELNINQRDTSLESPRRRLPELPSGQYMSHRQYIDWRATAPNEHSDPNDTPSPYARFLRTLSTQIDDITHYNQQTNNQSVDSVSTSQRATQIDSSPGILGAGPSYSVNWRTQLSTGNFGRDANLGVQPTRHVQFLTQPAPPKSFRCDYLPDLRWQFEKLPPKDCRNMVLYRNFNESNYNGDGEFIYHEQSYPRPQIQGSFQLPNVEFVAPSDGQAFNMFSNASRLVRQSILNSAQFKEQILMLAMYRCLQLYLSPEGTVPMNDFIGILLTRGYEQFVQDLLNLDDEEFEDQND